VFGLVLFGTKLLGLTAQSLTGSPGALDPHVVVVVVVSLLIQLPDPLNNSKIFKDWSPPDEMPLKNRYLTVPKISG